MVVKQGLVYFITLFRAQSPSGISRATSAMLTFAFTNRIVVTENGGAVEMDITMIKPPAGE
jgi:hypothetical protein